MGSRFGWLWAAYAVSAAGTWFAFDAFALIAVLVLHTGPAGVAALAAAGPAVGAAVAVVLGPWAEYRRRRPVMIACDLVRFAAVLTVPIAYVSGTLGLGLLLAVAVTVAAADIAFTAAAGAYLRGLVAPADLLRANGRFEATTWTATAIGPPLGGLAIGVFGPVTSVLANGVSYLLSACGLLAIGRGEPPPPARAERLRPGDLLTGWRLLLAHPGLRRLLLNTVLVNGLIMASAPLMAVLMLGELGFDAWQYGLAFGAPCVGGLLGARLARPLVARFGQPAVLRGVGALRACWPVGLAFVVPGPVGLTLVIALQLVLVACMGAFNPVLATYRLEQLPADGTVRGLSSWSVSTKAGIATLTAGFGLLAGVTGPRVAIGIAGVLLLATPLLLPRREPVGVGGPGR